MCCGARWQKGEEKVTSTTPNGVSQGHLVLSALYAVL